MPEGQVLEFSRLTKRFGSVRAVSDLTAKVEPGAVTGFLGPNGAGKTTTLRMLLGLVRPSSGTATIDGVPYAKLKKPLQTVGAVLEASSFHPGRTGANHLKIYAQAAGIPRVRIDETLGLVGLADAAGRKVGGYSLGMRQRLGLAYALLGDPGVLVLDEPANGLDPEGIKWLRGFLQQLAREGRTVLVSSHLLTEVQQTADAVLILADGRRVFNGAISDLVDPAEQATIVDSADRAGLVAALRDAGIDSEVLRSGVTVRTADPAAVGRAAAAAGIALTALQRRGPALEEVFLELVSGVRVHPSADAQWEDRAPAADAGTPGPEAHAEPAPAPAGAGSVTEPEAAAEPAGGQAVITGGVLVAPAVVAAAETPDEQTEFDAPPPGVDAAVDDEPEPRAAFAVAGTGVIDIEPTPVPPVDDHEPDARPTAEEPADSDEARAAEPGDEAIDEPVSEPGADDVPVGEAARGEPQDAEPEDEDAEPDEDEDEDEVSEDVESAYVTHSAHAGEDERTESDAAADAFFASFDHETAAGARDPGDRDTDAPAGPAEDAPRDSADGAPEDDGSQESAAPAEAAHDNTVESDSGDGDDDSASDDTHAEHSDEAESEQSDHGRTDEAHHDEEGTER